MFPQSYHRPVVNGRPRCLCHRQEKGRVPGSGVNQIPAPERRGRHPKERDAIQNPAELRGKSFADIPDFLRINE